VIRVFAWLLALGFAAGATAFTASGEIGEAKA